MKNFIKHISSAIIFLSSIVSIWFLLSNIRTIDYALFLLPILALIVFVLGINIFLPKLWKRIAQLKEIIYNNEKGRTILLCLIIIIIGLILRFFIFFYFDYKPISDPAQFLKNATSIAAGNGIANKFYLGFFPYLVAYTDILGLMIKIFNNSWLATIVLNSIFDISASLIVFTFIKQITKPKSIAPFVGLVLWMLSPFNILFSTLSLPVIAVNFFIIAGVYLIYLMSKCIVEGDIKKSVLYSIALGLVLGIANCFRPIFPVFLIALLLYLVFILLSIKELSKRVITLASISFIIVFCLFVTVVRINLA
ncbi:hypothetical protein KKA50_00430, partial [Patescibacteria group bacterium]|nr:hypothetical protein [Patescibacteria group bacterium]